MRHRLCVILSLLSVIGCHSEPEQTSHAVIEVSPEGRLIVTNAGISGWTTGNAWSLEEDLRLGSVDQPGPEQFTRIDAIVADPEGMIYVSDVLSTEIRVFHPDGRFSHTIGGRGQGPGEFRYASVLTWSPENTLWVMDPMNNRYSAFDRSGTFLQSYPRRLGSGALPGGILQDGRFVDWITSFPDEGPDVVAGGRLRHYPVRWSRDFEHADTLPPLEFRQEMIAHGTRPQVFFAERLETALGTMGDVWFAHTRQYRVYRRTLDGDTTLVFTLPYQAKPIEDGDREYVRTRLVNRPDLLAAYLEELPPTMPVIQRIMVDNAGHVFVVPDLAGLTTGSGIDVFRESGEYLGRLTVPTPIGTFPTGPVVYVTHDHLYYVVSDQHDVPFVVRARIRRPS